MQPSQGVIPLSVSLRVSDAIYRTVESFALDLQSGDDITPALSVSAPVGVVLARLCHALDMPIPPMLLDAE